jgi:hypothetical protein
MSPLLAGDGVAVGRASANRGDSHANVGRDRTVGHAAAVASVKRVGVWGLVAFLVFFVAYSPDSAASVARWLGRTLAGLATGFGDFVAGVVG